MDSFILRNDSTYSRRVRAFSRGPSKVDGFIKTFFLSLLDALPREEW